METGRSVGAREETAVSAVRGKLMEWRRGDAHGFLSVRVSLNKKELTVDVSYTARKLRITQPSS